MLSLRPQHGFTLIEVLVCLALMSLLATVLAMSLQLGGHAWQRVVESTGNLSDIDRAQGFLRRYLMSIRPLATAAGEAASVSNFNGSAHTVSFFTVTGSAGGIARLEIGLGAEDNSTVEISYRPDDWSSPSKAGSESREALIDHVASLSFQYWQQSSETDGHWTDHWEEPAVLPRLIRVDVGFLPKDARRWPPLYIEPRIDATANCIFDVVSRRCRSGT
jgi:general secretion pathway protein J